jgi:hypothetical protein
MEAILVTILQKHLLERLRLITCCFPVLAPDFCAAADVVIVNPLQSNCGLFINDHTLKHTTYILNLQLKPLVKRKKKIPNIGVTYDTTIVLEMPTL